MTSPSIRASRSAIAAVLTVCLSVPAAPLVAVADPADPAVEVASVADGTVDCSNGWKLSYVIEDGEASITGYTFTGSAPADLVVPDMIEGAPVVALAEDAFRGCTSLASVTLPDSLKYVEANALRSTSATAIAFGSGLVYIQSYGVANNSALKTVDFGESHPEFFQEGAFSSDTALAELRIPALLGTEHKRQWYSKNGMFRIGINCFNGCSNLKHVIYEAGNPNSASEYYSSEIYNVYGGVHADFSIVAYTKVYPTNSGYVTRSVDTYYAVYFYASKAEADADTDRTQYERVALIAKGTPVVSVSAGTVPASSYLKLDDAGTVPTLAEVGVTGADMVWGLSDSALSSASSTVANCLCAYPVEKGNMSYAYVTSSATDLYDTYTNQVTADRKENAAFHRLRANGTVDLTGITVHAADGSVLDESYYTLGFRRQLPVNRGQQASYETLSGVAAVNAEGTYGVRAVGKRAGYTNSATSYATFYVRRYDAAVSDYTASSSVAGGAVALAALGSQLGGAAFVTMAPASSWQACLVATAAAGMGGGIAVFGDGTDKNDGYYQAIGNSQAKYLVVVGKSAEVGQAAVDRARLTMGSGNTYSLLDASAAAGETYEETLARTVYEKLKKAGTTYRPSFAWGDTAIVLSRTSCLNTAAIAQYAYAKKAPIFFANASGGVSAATLSDLANFKNVVIAGTTAEVSAAAASQIAAKCGSTPRRIMTAATAGDSGTQLADVMIAEGLGSTATVSLGASTDPVSVFAAAQCAAVTGGLAFGAATTTDVKGIEAYLQKHNATEMSAVRLIGPVPAPAGGLATRMIALSQGKPYATSLQIGDTVSDGVLRYTATSASTVQVSGFVQGATASVAIPATVSAGGKALKVTAVAPSAFANQTTLKTVSVGANVATIGASAFQGATALTAVSGCAGVTSVGASAFQGCTKLVSAALPKVKAIPSKTFYGCAALKAFAVPSTCTSIGASAFYGCKALTKVTGATKVTTLGSSAFQGATKLASIALARVKAIPSKAFYGCAALKTFKVPSTCTSIGTSAFYGCKALTKVTGATKLKTIGTTAFRGCAKLKSVTLGKKVTTIGSKAFYGCKVLSSLTLTAVVKKVGASAFYGCKKLTTLKVASTKLTRAGLKSALKGSSVKTVKLSTASAKKKLATYKKYFAKGNSGKSVTVKKA